MRVLRNFNQIPRAFADSNFLGRLRVSQERNQDFSKEWGGGGGGESHTVSHLGYLPDCHVDIHTVFY